MRTLILYCLLALTKTFNGIPIEKIVDLTVTPQKDESSAAWLVDKPDVRFSELPKSVEAHVGQSFELSCAVIGSPQPKIYWLKDGRRIKQATNEDDDSLYDRLLNVGMVTVQNGIIMSKLKFDCVSAAMNGVYQCVADNGFQRILSPQSTVSIRDDGQTRKKHCQRERSHVFRAGSAPQIYMWTDTRMEVSGASAQLICRAKGYPDPVVYWMDNENQIITNTNKYVVLSNGDLLIKKADWEMMGQFSCVATNEHGKDTKETFFYPTASEEGPDTSSETETV